MPQLAPIVVSVYDRDFTPNDWIPAPVRVEATIAHNEVGTAVLVLDGDDEQVDVLTEPGARVVIEYRYDPLNPTARMPLVSGLVMARRGEAAGAQTRTFDVVDWFSILRWLLGWPNPSGTITQQGDDEAYYTLTGPAETVIKGLVAANLSRVGVPLTIAPDLGRGAVITVSVRNHPIYDRAFPAVDLAGIGVTIRQQGAGLVLDCYEPSEYEYPLTEASGVVVDGSFELTGPTATRAVVMGQGEGTARIMAEVIDHDLEAEWGVAIAIAVDARNNDGDPAALAADGWEALAEHAPKATVSAVLAETDEFRLGVAVNLGDRLPVQLNNAPPIVERLRSATIVWDAEAGLEVTPIVGDEQDDPDAVLYDAVANLARSQRAQIVGR